MEKRRWATNRRGKNKGQISVNGGNIGGLAVWVGAMAAAGLVAAFTVKKCIRRDTDKKEGSGNKGMGSTLQSSTTFPCSKTDGSAKKPETQYGSCDVVSSESLISEKENPSPMTNGGNENSSGDQQEILVIDESKRETAAPCDGCDCFESNCKVVDELSLPELDAPLMNKEEGKTENNTDEEWQLIQGTDVLKEKVVESEKVTDEKNLIEIGGGFFNESKQEEIAAPAFDRPSMNEEARERESESGKNWQVLQEIVVLKDVAGGSEKATTVKVNESKQETFNERVSFESSYEDSDDPLMNEAKSEIKNASREDLQLKQGNKVWTAGGEDSGKKTTEKNSIEVDEEGYELQDSSEECDQEKGEEKSGEARNVSTSTINEKVEDKWQLMKRITATDEEQAIDTEKAEEKSSPVDSDKENKSTEESPFTESSEVDDWEDEEEEEEDGNEEYTVQKGEESSEGTACTSPESNVEAVWPVEVIEEFPTQLQKATKDLEERIVDKDKPAEKEELGKFTSSIGGKDGNQATEKVVSPEDERNHETMELHYQTEHSTKWRIWVLSTSTILLLVLLILAHRSALSYRSLNREPALFHEL